MLFYHGGLIRIRPDSCFIGGGPANSVAFGSLPLIHRLVYIAVDLVRYMPVLMLFGYRKRRRRCPVANALSKPAILGGL